MEPEGSFQDSPTSAPLLNQMNIIILFSMRNLGGSVSMVSGYRLDDRGSILSGGKGFFL
jgi:hypothetical protein